METTTAPVTATTTTVVTGATTIAKPLVQVTRRVQVTFRAMVPLPAHLGKPRVTQRWHQLNPVLVTRRWLRLVTDEKSDDVHDIAVNNDHSSVNETALRRILVQYAANVDDNA